MAARQSLHRNLLFSEYELGRDAQATFAFENINRATAQGFVSKQTTLQFLAMFSHAQHQLEGPIALSNGHAMLIFFWDWAGPIQLDLLSHGERINAPRYCEYVERTNCDLSRRRCRSLILLENSKRLGS
ncbi:hypothetical protein KIN20_037399 [Parelaphostrongylus tenuis]|uniref:Uncharacterized protein n=1 Tax=Parelaphostrongylus tenuis TaxID=148309 RepID=A0AAD5RDX0_PARTN|nr:hypothetical protein KIN20_037399 [Parelaphostrongylus tenuis]